MTRKNYRKATLAEQIEISKLIEENIEQHDDGTVSYTNGYNDAIVAVKVGGADGGLGEGHVQTVRKQLFGNLAVAVSPSAKITKLEGTVNSLLTRVAQLEAQVGMLRHSSIGREQQRLGDLL